MIPLIPQRLCSVLRNVLEEEDPDLSGFFLFGRVGGSTARVGDVGGEEGLEESGGGVGGLGGGVGCT